MGDSRFNPVARQFAEALKDRALLKDAFGRDLSPGDLVAIEAPLKRLFWRVGAITPVVDPRQPPNLLHVQLSVTMTITVPKTGQPLADIFRVVAAVEATAPAVEVTDAGGPESPPDPVTES